MGLMDFIKGELIDVIEWTDDSRDTLSYRYPDDDKAIKNGAQLIVRESQVAQFVYLGEFGDTFGPGKHTLTRRDRIVSANSSSRKCWSVPATSFRNFFGSVIRKSYVPNARRRTMPKSLSRIITGFAVPHLLPVKRRVTT